MKPQIDIAVVEDIPQLLQLVNSAYRGEDAKKGWTHEADLISGSIRTDENSLLQMITDSASVILKYTLESNVVGCVYLQNQNDKLYLGMLSVSPQVQANGIGKQLLSAAENHAKKLSCSKIGMTVISERQEIIDWYIRHGYHLTGETKPFPADGRFGMPKKKIEFVVLEKNMNSF